MAETTFNCSWCGRRASGWYPSRAAVRAKMSPYRFCPRPRLCQRLHWEARERQKRLAALRPYPCAWCGRAITPQLRPGRKPTYCEKCRRHGRRPPRTVAAAQADFDRVGPWAAWADRRMERVDLGKAQKVHHKAEARIKAVARARLMEPDALVESVEANLAKGGVTWSDRLAEFETALRSESVPHLWLLPGIGNHSHIDPSRLAYAREAAAAERRAGLDREARESVAVYLEAKQELEEAQRVVALAGSYRAQLQKAEAKLESAKDRLAKKAAYSKRRRAEARERSETGAQLGYIPPSA